GAADCVSGVGSASEAHCASSVGRAGELHCASGVGSARETHCASSVCNAGAAHCASGVGSARAAHCASDVGSAGAAHCASSVGSAGAADCVSGVGSASEAHCASGVGKANEAHSASCTGNAPEPNNASLVRTVPSWQKLQALDEIYGASRGPFELREGSRKLATRFEKTTDAFCEIPLLANGTHGENSTGRASEMHGAKTAAYQAVYFPVAYGTHCAERGIPLEECLAAFTYSQVSARVTTCVKLVPLSQSEGQRILYSLMKNFSDIVAKCFTLSENDLCRSSPGLDLRAMQHEYLYSRLYSN
ncbi:MAG: urease accessory UreF family protein, partial [Treponema sp.]|nr:urease accessory UreF family protein [Treponema sp.]